MKNATNNTTAKSAAYLKGQETKARNLALKAAQEQAQQAPAINPVFTALNTRLQACENAQLVNQADAMRNTIKRTSSALCDLAQSKLTSADFDVIAQRIAHVNAQCVGLEQVKTIDKIVRFIGAVALDQPSQLCNYLKVSALTTLKNDGSASVTEMVCALSRSAYRSNMSTLRSGFENLAGYSIGTGSSQASQARQVFNVFGFYTGFVKGGRDNKPTLTKFAESTLSGLVFAKAQA